MFYYSISMKSQNLITILLLAILFLNCGSSKKETTSSKTFVLDNAKVKLIDYVSFQKWVAGQEKGGSGYHIEIYQAKNGSTLQLEHIYFRGLKGDIILGKKGYTSTLKKRKENDIQLSTEPSDEYQNTLPTASELPFLINDNECVISYVNNDTVKFIKVLNLKEKPAQYYPSTKPRN